MRRLHPKNLRGVAIVEFTIVLPLLLLLILATAEVGRLIYQYNTLTKAVENGARYLASNVRGAGSSVELNQLISEAEALITYGTTDLGSSPSPLLPGAVAISAETAAVGPNPIVVTASYTYSPMVVANSIPTFGLGNDIDLTFPMTARVGMPEL